MDNSKRTQNLLHPYWIRYLYYNYSAYEVHRHKNTQERQVYAMGKHVNFCRSGNLELWNNNLFGTLKFFFRSHLLKIFMASSFWLRSVRASPPWQVRDIWWWRVLLNDQQLHTFGWESLIKKRSASIFPAELRCCTARWGRTTRSPPGLIVPPQTHKGRTSNGLTPWILFRCTFLSTMCWNCMQSIHATKPFKIFGNSAIFQKQALNSLSDFYGIWLHQVTFSEPQLTIGARAFPLKVRHPIAKRALSSGTTQRWNGRTMAKCMAT